jgi:hypothetical protein
MPGLLPNPLYYLENFQRVVSWIGEHHDDLLTSPERDFLAAFDRVPEVSRALLVRMVMRKGEVFRTDKLLYDEIGCPLAAAGPLVAQGWVDERPVLECEVLCRLMTKPEIQRHLASHLPPGSLSKSDMLAALAQASLPSRPFDEWCPGATDAVFRLRVKDFCERLRLMFFGNARQDWSEFVLADLGIYRYEAVEISPASRAFGCRQDVDDYLHLHRCRERLDAGEAAQAVLDDIPAQPHANPWLEARRGKLLLALGTQLERENALPQALQVHAQNAYAGARVRCMRVLEKLGQPDAALELACAVQARPETECEAQQVGRILSRLQRTLGQAAGARRKAAVHERLDLVLPAGDGLVGVERRVQDHLASPQAPVHYVENTLFNALFGLLCWDALYAPLPGAFFHPFHAAPADLFQPGFRARRAGLFAACLARLDSLAYVDVIRERFRAKQGVQSRFVAWGILDEALLEQALRCLPAAHLKKIFERMLDDLADNCTGLPDLIQFLPGERSYRMVEVKGPGDRLQDNQKRWLNFFMAHGMPVTVCYVQWSEALS